MRKARIVISLVVVLLLVPAFVFAQGARESAAQTTMRLAWWGNPTRDAKTYAAIDAYTAANPKVTIEPETTGWAGYWDKMNTQAAAGNLPDLMQHDYAYMLQWVTRNQLKDLTPYVNSGVINLSKVADANLSGGRVGGKLYGISLGSNAVCVIYDKALLDQIGISFDDTTWTLADFERISLEVYRKTGVKTLPFFTTDPKVGFDNLIRQTGNPFFAPDGKSLGFTDTTVLREFFAVQLRLLDAGALVSPEIAFVTVSPDEGEFAKRTSWVTYGWSNQVVAEQAAAGRPVEIALMPRIDGSQRPGTFLKPSMFFSIPVSASNPDEAARFLNFFLNDIELNNTVLLGERGVPIPDDVRDAMSQVVDPVNKQIFAFISKASQHSSAIDPPDPAPAGEVLKLFRDVTQEILGKRVSVDAGVAKIMADANAILAR
ncbi:ABC transporter substrate-binding protein [Parasphaerochaeta coccoides]|uniref:Extracellular solute-binding protein family 1 n=1 Tax=Parasphaerochaeta coccoides (strain ATCC BAA-1237 / DSM 17374 / SPN1) TaxID=760011 RepID=F4GHY0_PARC1|nr:extracellular solute-binding protein [Parasphaerochaeta coccoides]AEC02093.1 extracellular solute-binding protein family 1 [Parasphaerochaeta coccoides DSM 17374]